MNRQYKILLFSLLCVFCLTFTACAKCISTEYKDVEVKVVDEYHRAMWTQPIPCGKTYVLITHPAVHHITVEYDGVEYTVSGSATYYEYRNKIGQTVTGELQVNSYDNGNVKYDIVALKG